VVGVGGSTSTSSQSQSSSLSQGSALPGTNGAACGRGAGGSTAASARPASSARSRPASARGGAGSATPRRSQGGAPGPQSGPVVQSNHPGGKRSARPRGGGGGGGGGVAAVPGRSANCRTSATHPIPATLVLAPRPGALSLSFCPGKRVRSKQTGLVTVRRSLRGDLARLRDMFGVTHVVALIDAHEARLLDVADEEAECAAARLAFSRFPIVEMAAPADAARCRAVVAAMCEEIITGTPGALAGVLRADDNNDGGCILFFFFFFFFFLFSIFFFFFFFFFFTHPVSNVRVCGENSAMQPAGSNNNNNNNIIIIIINNNNATAITAITANTM
jgi:hypothetical protein